MVPRTTAVLAVAAFTAVATPGCFYTDLINDVPSASITLLDPAPHLIGQPIRFSATKSDDADRAQVRAEWKALACVSVTPRTDCEELSRQTLGLADEFVVTPKDHRPLAIELTITDHRGAEDIEIYVLDIANADPEIDVQLDGYAGPGGAFVVTRRLELAAEVVDPDGDDAELEAFVVPPPGSDPGARAFDEIGDGVYELLPDVAGLWQVELSASDGHGGEASHTESILVAPDGPPCIALTAPEAVADAAYLLGALDPPRTFAVLRVDDDLDRHPTPDDGDPITDAPHFSWSLAGPGDDGFVPVEEHDAAALVVDPADFRIGDRLWLRVEVDDRIGRELTCETDAATCAVDSGSGCVQRVTWTVEIR